MKKFFKNFDYSATVTILLFVGVLKYIPMPHNIVLYIFVSFLLFVALKVVVEFIFSLFKRDSQK
ncbi:unnamed protein product [Fructobacillus cardui]|nr:unnamed protein product [Fructobacillus cardui]